MYVPCGDKAVVGEDGNTTTYSEAVTLNEANAAQVEYTIFNLSGTSLQVTLQESNDGENWSDRSADTARTAMGYWTFQVSSLGCKYARLKYVVSGGSLKAVISAGINAAHL